MFRSIIASDVHALDRMKSRWERFAVPSIFQSFHWTRMALSMFATTAAPRIVLAESDSGLAIIPAALSAGGTSLGLIGEELFDYRDVLQEGDGNVLRHAWGELASLSLPLDFYSLRGELAQRRWAEFEPQPFCNSLYASPSDVTAAEFREHHSRLQSRERKLLRKGITLRQHDGSSSALLKLIYERKSAQPTPQGNLFTDERRREFMVRVAAADPASCEIFTYETAGELVAAVVTFRHQNVRHFYTVYYDVRWSSLSPGQLLVYEVTARSLAAGLTCDFLTGEYPYKKRVATGSVPLYRVMATPETIAAVAEERTITIAA